MYSYGSPHTAAQKQDDQHERTFSSYVRIQVVVLKTYQGRWTIGRSGERGSGISVLPARYDDDDDYRRYEGILKKDWFAKEWQKKYQIIIKETVHSRTRKICKFHFAKTTRKNNFEKNKDFSNLFRLRGLLTTFLRQNFIIQCTMEWSKYCKMWRRRFCH